MKACKTLMAFCLLSATACTEMFPGHETILDGSPSEIYEADLQSCQHLAMSQSFHEDTIGAVIAGAAFAGLMGGHEGDVSTGEAAAAGALFGWIGALFDQAEKRQSMVFECMKGRGHRVVG